MPCTALLVGWLTIFVPPGMTAGDIETDHYTDVFGIPGNTTDEWTLSLSGKTSVSVFVWSGQPPFPGQPAETLTSVKVPVHGGPIELHRRKLVPNGDTFDVAYPLHPGGKGQALVRIDGVGEAAARALLTDVLGGGRCR